LLFLFELSNAQEILTLENAVKCFRKQLRNKIATNTLSIEKQMWQLVCGMLPTVTATVLDNNSIQNSSQIRQDGTKLN
jgi:hypothetical protein